MRKCEDDTIESRSAYGRTNYYALGEYAAPIKALTKRETLTFSDVGALEDLGFRCVIVGRPEMPACEVIGCCRDSRGNPQSQRKNQV